MGKVEGILNDRGKRKKVRPSAVKQEMRRVCPCASLWVLSQPCVDMWGTSRKRLLAKDLDKISVEKNVAKEN